MIKSKVGIGPMSREVIKAVIEKAYEQDQQLMLIASRNQVECNEYGGGYTGFSTEAYVDFIKELDPQRKVLICRDHSGPYFASFEKNLKPEEAIETTLNSIKKDIQCGFDVIHVDCCQFPGDVIGVTKQIIREAQAYAHSMDKSIKFEIGSEENIGKGASDVKKFEKELAELSEIVKPEFIVAQTGSLTKEIFQVGYFDLEGTKKLVSVAHSYGVKFKEHNADYTTKWDLALRKSAGVDAINVAPEFGYYQTRIVTSLGHVHGHGDLVDDFLRKSLESCKWKKWLYGDAIDEHKSMIAGHYVFQSQEYRKLTNALSEKVDLEKEIIRGLKTLIDKYLEGLQ